MDILSRSHVACFIGALRTEKPFFVRSKKRGKKDAIAAKIAEHWLNDPKNRLTILSQLCELVRSGTAIGMITGTDSLLPVRNSEFYASPVTRKRREKKTKGDENGRQNS